MVVEKGMENKGKPLGRTMIQALELLQLKKKRNISR